LKRKGYDVSVAVNGVEAIKVIEEETFDLIVTDIVIPEKDGLSTILQTKRDNKNIKIIAISGGDRSFTGSSYLQIAKNIGVERTFQKPFNSKEFLRAVKEVFQNE
jgi:YesN/AraC family two-component response regulator